MPVSQCCHIMSLHLTCKQQRKKTRHCTASLFEFTELITMLLRDVTWTDKWTNSVVTETIHGTVYGLCFWLDAYFFLPFLVRLWQNDNKMLVKIDFWLNQSRGPWLAQFCHIWPCFVHGDQEDVEVCCIEA